jgi:hypothetical protein
VAAAFAEAAAGKREEPIAPTTTRLAPTNKNKQTTARNRDEVDTQLEFMALGVLGVRESQTLPMWRFTKKRTRLSI